MVQRRGHRGVAGGAAHDPGRAALVLPSGDPDGADPAGRVSPRPAPSGGADRLHHSAARARSGGTLKLCGAGEWLAEKHGTSKRRSWRKLHIGLDADTGRIVAAALTTNDVDDGSQVGPLLDQVATSVASFTADGAYDQDGVSAAVTERHPEAVVI